MKNFTKLLCLVVCIGFTSVQMLYSQIPADQDTVLIPGGIENEGLLETTINGDVDAEGNRVNPNRVYMLEAGQVYYQVSSINFGGELDTAAVLSIVGEKGMKKPLVLMKPAGGAGSFGNNVHGSLTLKHVYWPSMNIYEEGHQLWNIYNRDQTIVLEDVIAENQFTGAYVHLRTSLGKVNIFIKDCYFRDFTQLANSWNRVIFARSDEGDPIDTLWVENMTFVTGGMPLFGKENPVNFAYINHCTFVNTTKYPIWMEKFKEGYLTNNVFINCNYEGECESTWETQLADPEKNGIINLDTIDAPAWEKHFPEMLPAPGLTDIKFLASNNLNYYSPYLEKYFTGGYNDVFDVPMSNRTYAADITEDDIPIPVSNIPVHLFSQSTIDLMTDHSNIKADNNYDRDTDLGWVTEAIESQEVADEFAKFARSNYGVAEEGETYDKNMIWIGDGLATTIPGEGQESSQAGLTDATDFPEDFSYTSDIRSTIDGLPLGSLQWWPTEHSTYNSRTSLARVLDYYETGIGVGVDMSHNVSGFHCTVYPVPAQNQITIKSELDINTVSIINVMGQQVAYKNLNGVSRGIVSLSGLEKGIYFVKIQSVNGEETTTKLIKK